MTPRCSRCSWMRPAASPRPTTTCSSRALERRIRSTTRRSSRSSTGVFHNRVTVNDSMLLGGNPPFQPQVGVSNGRADDPGGVGGAGSLPFGMTAIDRVFKHPTAYMWSAGVQRRCRSNFVVDVTYVGRRGLYNQRERDINQLLPGTVQANPGVNVAALRPYKGYGVIRLAENAGNSKYNSLQISADRRYSERIQVRRCLHARHTHEDDASGQARRPVQQLRRHPASGATRASIVATCSTSTTSTTCRSIAIRPELWGRCSADGRSPGRRSCGRARRSGSREGADIAGIGDTFGNPWNLDRRSERQRERPVLGRRHRRSELLVRSDGVHAAGSRHVRQRRRGTTSTIPASISGTSRCSRTSAWAGRRTLQFRAEIFNFINHANWNGADANPTSATFGRVTGKDDNRRDIQLSVRFMF